jgi:co-chaperonin GroES (HSP10)
LLEPVANRVLVKMRPEETTPGGLHIPENARTEWVGDVVAVGPGRKIVEGYESMQVKPGDVVLLNPMLSGVVPPVIHLGVKYFMFMEHEILAIVRDEPTVTLDGN